LAKHRLTVEGWPPAVGTPGILAKRRAGSRLTKRIDSAFFFLIDALRLPDANQPEKDQQKSGCDVDDQADDQRHARRRLDEKSGGKHDQAEKEPKAAHGPEWIEMFNDFFFFSRVVHFVLFNLDHPSA
jgi:hypothetical protein